jgi:hypothetical protein
MRHASGDFSNRSFILKVYYRAEAALAREFVYVDVETPLVNAGRVRGRPVGCCARSSEVSARVLRAVRGAIR